MAIQKVMLISPLTPGMLMVIIMLMMAILSRRCEDEYVKMLMLMVIIMLMMAILRKVYDDLFPSVAALPGVARLVHHLAKHQVRVCNIRVLFCPLVADRFQNLYLILGLQCKACSSVLAKHHVRVGSI